MPNIERVDSPHKGNGLHSAECIAPTCEDSVEFLVGTTDYPNGLRRFIVSRPHVSTLSKQFAEAIEQRTSYSVLGKRTTREIFLPEDSADIMRLIMLVAHLDSARLPAQLGLSELVRLAETSERYNVSRILVPYLDSWLAPHRERIKDPGYEQWLVVAYYFGLEKDYLQLSDYFVLNCQIDSEGNLLHPVSSCRMC